MTVCRGLLLALAITVVFPQPSRPDDAPGADIVLRKRVRGDEKPPGGGPASGQPTTGSLDEDKRLVPLLGDSFEALGESLASFGTFSFPTPDGSSILLDGSDFPLLRLSSGRSLILDLEGRLGAEESNRIEQSWEGYRVIPVQREGNLRRLMGSILAESGFYRLSLDAPLTIGRAGEVSITPDFLVVKSPDDALRGSLYLVSVHDDPDHSLPVQLRDLAGEHRIKVIEIFPAGGEVRAAEPPRGEYWSPGRKFTASDPRLLLGEIAPSLGMTVVEEPSLFLAPELRPLLRDRRAVLLSREGRLCLVTFGTGADPCRDGTARTVSCLHGSGLPFPALLGEVLRSLGVPHRGPNLEFFLPGQRFTLTVPGFYVEDTDGRPVLVTGKDLGGHLSSLMTESGVNVLTWIVRGAGR